MRKVCVIKIFSTGRNLLLCGEQKENEILVDETAKRIISENDIRNRGNFIVISQAGDTGTFITEFSDGIGYKGSFSTIWINDLETFMSALQRMQEAVRDA